VGQFDLEDGIPDERSSHLHSNSGKPPNETVNYDFFFLLALHNP
jgi:hypothetical protein